MTEGGRRWRGRLLAMAFSLAALAAAALVLEAVCRRDPRWRDLAREDPPFVSLTGAKRFFSEGAFPSAPRTLIAIGGSTTAGFPFPLAGFPEWAQHDLHSCGETDIALQNRSSGGFGSRREEVALRQALAEKPWAVVFYPGQNEDGEERLYRSLPRWQFRRFLPWAYEHSALVTALIRRAARARFNPFVETSGGVFGYPKSYGEANPNEVASGFESRLREMIRLSRASGARAVLCVAPVDPHFRPVRPPRCADNADFKAAALLDAGKAKEALALLAASADPSCAHVSTALWASGMAAEKLGDFGRARRDLLEYADQSAPSPARFREIERRVGGEEGALVVDLDAFFSAGTKDGLPDSKYFTDSHHLSALGYRLAGREIVKALAKDGAVPARCPGPAPAIKFNGPYGLILDGMEKDLGLSPLYRAEPEMTLANVYGFYFDNTKNAWFEERARAWMADAIKVNEAYVRPHIRRDNPVIARLAAEVYAAQGR